MPIDGKQIAQGIIARLKTEPAPVKFLGVLFVGENPASVSFIRQKERIARELGLDFRIVRLPEASTQEEIVVAISKLAADATCGGILVQLPLPTHIDRGAIIKSIPKEKDVDALRGEGTVLPPAVGVVDEILQTTNYKLQTSTVAVVGMGFLVGKPIAAWLSGRCAELMTLDIGDDLGTIRNADVVVLGTGQPGLIKAGMLKQGALIIDFGYGTKDGRTCGDFDPSGQTTNDKQQTAIAYTPTPGGTGPILVAKLFENFYSLNQN